MGVKKKQDGLIEYIDKVYHRSTSHNSQKGNIVNKSRILKNYPIQTSQLQLHRSKRSFVLLTKKDYCKSLQIQSAVAEGAAGVASAASSAASSVPFFGSGAAAASAGVAAAMYTAKVGCDVSYIENDCADVPFDEIKDILEKNFNKLEKGIDRNFAALQEVSKTAYKTLLTVEQTRIEMHQGFNHVLESIKQLKIEPVLSNMNIFMQYFDNEKNKINNLSKSKYIARIQETNNVLSYLKDSITPKGDTLYTLIYNIVNRNFAYPEKADDISGFSALYALHYGTQTYFSVMLFLLEQHCYLADYYYQNGDLDMYNKHFDNVQAVYDDFKNLLVEKNNNGLIDKVIDIITEVKQKSFLVDESDLLKSLSGKIEALTEMKREINEMILPVIDDIPEKLSGKPKFKHPGTSTPIGEWKDEARVVYAMQYKNNEIYSKVGDWSRPFVVHGKANPILRIPPDTEERTRLIFRKFNENKPQLVGIINDRFQTSFLDINRDLYNAASWSNEDLGKAVVNILIQNGADVNAVFDQGRSAIHAAAESGNTLIAMNFLNDTNINIKDDYGYTPLHLAAKEGNDDFIQMLIEHGADVNAKTYADQVTPLHLAVREGDVPTINTLMQYNKTDVNIGDKDNFTPLHNAVNSGLSVVKALLTNKNIAVNSKSKTGLAPLHLATINNQVDIAEALSANNLLNVNIEVEHNYTPLHFASIGGHLDIVKYFKRNETNFNAKTDVNWTPLHFAVALKHDIVAMELLNEERIDVNLKTDDGVTPLHIAVGTGQENVTLQLLQNGANIEDKTKDGLTPLHIASMHKNKDIVAILVDNGAILESRGNKGLTPLLAAVEMGNFDIIKYLLDKNANLKATDNDGNTVVHLSAKFGHYDIIKYFADEKRFYIYENRGGSPLYLAIQNSHLNIIKYFIEEKNLDANCKTGEYDCPLYEATKFDSVDVVRYLVNKYPRINLNSKPLENCVQYGNLNVLKYLIEEKGANINAKNVNGEAPLHIAAKYGWLNIVKYLIEEKKVDFNKTKDVWLKSPLHVAVSSGNLNLVKYLIEVRHVDASIKDKFDATPLHYAIYGLNGVSLNDKESSNIVQYLVDVRKVNVNAKDIDGDTPLHRAVIYKSIYPIKFLISRGADLERTNKNDKTASDIATDNSIQQLLDLQSLCNIIIDDDSNFFFGIYYELEINSKCVDPRQIIDDDIFESTALNLAITYDQTGETAMLLMKKGSYLNIGDQLGNTPLHLSVRKCNVQLINELIKNGADVDIKNNNKQIPEDIAKENCAKEIIEILHKAKLNKDLRTATDNNNLLLMKEFIQQEAHLDTKDQYGNALVHIASSKGYIDILNYLIEIGCNINTFNNNGRNAIYLAITNGHFDIVQILLNNGAEANTSDHFYRTYSHWILEEDQSFPVKVKPNETNGLAGVCLGIQHEKLDTIKLLIDERNSLIESSNRNQQYDIHKSIKDGNLNNLRKILEGEIINLNYLYKGLSPLADACINGQLSTVKYLIENGSDINKISMMGCTPLHWSVFSGHLDIVKYLIENTNATKDALDAGGRNILHYSVIYGNLDILKYLLNEKRADITSTDTKNNTVVHFAAEWGRFDILKYLIEDKHAEISTKSTDGSLPLHKAAGNGFIEIVKYLAKKSDRFDDIDNNGKTPLFIASENGYLEIVKYLKDRGANMTVQDKQGHTPAFSALKIGHFDIALYLILENGAKPSIVDQKYYPSDIQEHAIKECMFTKNGRKVFMEKITAVLEAIVQGIGEALGNLFNQPSTTRTFMTNTKKSRSIRSATSQDTIETNHTAVCLENNFALGLLLLQNYLDKKYPHPSFVQVTPEEARASALEITEKFEELLKKSTKINEGFLENINFYQLYLDIEANIRNEKFSNVPKTIFEFSKKLCINDEETNNVITGMLHEMLTNFKKK